MGSPSGHGEPPASVGKQEPFFRVFFAVGLLIAAMSVLDLALARVDRQSKAQTAAQLYREGEALMQKNDYAHARERFREALKYQPASATYQIALLQTMQHLGQLDEAETSLNELLQTHPAEGDANLLMARIQRARHHTDDAAWYYHRALYGTWPSGSDTRRVAVRFELADLLAQADRPQDLLAELLPLADAAPKDHATRRRLAQMFLAAHSWNRAAAYYRDLIHESLLDASAYRGLGDAQFGAGQFQQAERSYHTAMHLDPTDTTLAGKLDSSKQLAALDPTVRGLHAPERAQRSRALLTEVLAMSQACADVTKSPAAENAREALNADAPEDSEEDVTLAGQLWREREKCAVALPAGAQGVGVLIAKIAPLQ